MSPTKKSKKDLLGERAETLLSKKPAVIQKIPPEDIKKLIHEFELHRVELEMQNEELRKAQAEIEESRSKYIDLYDFAPVGYFTLNGAGRIVHVNLTAAKLLGVERAKLIGRIFSAFVAPGFRSIFRDHCQKILRPRSEKERCELKLIKKDRTFFYASLESIIAANGRSRSIRSAVIDITGRKQGEEEIHKLNQELEQRIIERATQLKTANKNLRNEIAERKRDEERVKAASLYTRSLIEASLDPLVTISADGKVMDVNKATELVTGASREQLIGSDFSNFFTEPTKAREGYRQVFLTGSVRDYPLAVSHVSGKVTPVLYNATVYRNETGEVQGVFAAARDITELKKAEEALRDSESRLRILSSQLLVAQEQERRRIAREVHDGLGQFLTAIKIRAEDVLGQIDEKMDKIREPLEAMIPVIKESIEETRRLQMDLRPPLLDDLGIIPTVSWFCREFEKTYPAIHIEKQIAIEEKAVSNILKTVIYRISQEAFNNIGKHSKAKLVILSLRKIGGTIELAIQDNGQGFDLDKMLSLEGSTAGMGLSSMRERAQLSGGTFVIESTKGKGTVIRVTWPVN